MRFCIRPIDGAFELLAIMDSRRQFVINMKTAKALSLAVCKSMQLLADEVME